MMHAYMQLGRIVSNSSNLLTSDRSAIRFVHFFGDMDRFRSVFSPMSYRNVQTYTVDIINHR